MGAPWGPQGARDTVTVGGASALTVGGACQHPLSFPDSARVCDPDPALGVLYEVKGQLRAGARDGTDKQKVAVVSLPGCSVPGRDGLCLQDDQKKLQDLLALC